jgi:tetratricopeptide (TPR) repeat protein
MAEESENERSRQSAPQAADDVAWTLLGAASREKADAFLDEQVAVLRLQKERLESEDEIIAAQVLLELSHLRFRRFSDYARSLLEISVGIVAVLVVCGLAALIWNAANDHDLIVDAFSVPPDVAQSGMTGAVLASRVLDKFGAMQSGHMSTTQDVGSYRGSDTSEVRVEIPDTGISIGDLYLALRSWLGHEIHVTGDLVRTAKGYALTVRVGAQPGATSQGADFDALAQQGAEHIFAVARPLRYAEYLAHSGRAAESEAIALPFAGSGNPHDRALAYSALALAAEVKGDELDMLAKSREAVRLDPDNPAAMGWLTSAESDFDHEENALNDAIAVIPLWHGSEAAGLDPETVAGGPFAFGAFRDEFKGDFQDAVAGFEQAPTVEPQYDTSDSRAEDSARDHDLTKARLVAETVPKESGGQPSERPLLVQLFIALAADDWSKAIGVGNQADTILRGDSSRIDEETRFLEPWLAYALAENGDNAKAQALIAKTPPDCDLCVDMRGNVAAAAHDWVRAAHWFAIVSARTPSVPFADFYWGKMLMAKGDLNGAVAKFTSAHAKGPHFADPLEAWGEILMLQNRSDLALAKFEEANKYAPNWGRLHLKWGEALLYAGQSDEAKQQFATAAGLGLSASDGAALARVAHL